jgi:hypothetical protein
MLLFVVYDVLVLVWMYGDLLYVDQFLGIEDLCVEII